MKKPSQQYEICKNFFYIAKIQYENKKISLNEYNETLELILEKLNLEELKYNQLEKIISIYTKPNFELNLKDAINHALSIN